MKNRKIFLFLSFILLLSVVLMGCSSAEDTSTDNDQSTTEEASGGTLVLGRGGDSVDLDPAIVTDGESFRVTKNIFETLIEFDTDSTELVPGLAKEWEVSPDGLTYTFKLQEGVKFHDGTDFNAEAVVYNFERWNGGDKER